MIPKFNPSSKLGFSINTVDPSDLPKFDETKRLTCPGQITVKEVITFVN